MRKAVVIPSYRAQDTLASVIETLPQELWEDGSIAVIVNDGSPDQTGEVADQLQRDHPGRVHVIHHPRNRGYGGALKTGLRYGLDEGFEIMPVVHSDGQYAPDQVLRLCTPIEEGYLALVQGSRVLGGGAREGGMPFSRYLANRLLTRFENLVVGSSVAEFHSGYMVYPAEALRRVPFEALQNNYCFDAEMMMLATLAKIPIVEIAIPTRYDDETSSLDPIPYGLNVLRMTARYDLGHYRLLLDQHEAAHPELGS